jgi:predicted phage terminase large subunit-like protein
VAEIRVRLPILHPGQKRVAENAGRYNVLTCGRRWGKTKFGIHRLLTGPKNLLDPAGYPAGWFAPSSRYVEDVWDELGVRLAGLIEYKNRQAGRMRFVTGSTLDFWAMGEDKEVARGRRYARVIVDEAAHIRYLEEAWTKAVEPTLTDFQGEAWFISTPNGLNYFHQLHRRGEQADAAWRAWQMPSRSNPHIPAEEIEAKRGLVPHLVFLQEYEAQFVTFGGGLVKPEHLVDGKAPAGLPVVLGVDLAISEKQGADWTAIAAMSRDPASGLVYLREVERHRLGFHEVLQRIKAAAARWAPTVIAIEQTQYQAAVVQELARTTTLPVRGIRPDRDKLTRFAPLLTRYEQRMVRHDPAGAPAWFREELLAFPEGEHDDAVDACAYAYQALAYTQPQPVALKVAGL